jgi:AraC-like DNA-binding protein
MVIARLLARLDRLALTAHDDSDERSRDELLVALLSALAYPALPLAGVRGCAQALHMTLSSAALRREDLTGNACDLVRQATRRAVTARHPTARDALAILLKEPRWWEEGDLARQVAASRSHFARIVHQETGFEYRTLRRLVVMKAGVIDVLTTDEQVAQIAYRVGMHPGKFDEVFRETFGCCPRELRRLWSRLPR